MKKYIFLIILIFEIIIYLPTNANKCATGKLQLLQKIDSLEFVLEQYRKVYDEEYRSKYQVEQKYKEVQQSIESLEIWLQNNNPEAFKQYQKIMFEPNICD